LFSVSIRIHLFFPKAENIPHLIKANQARRAIFYPAKSRFTPDKAARSAASIRNSQTEETPERQSLPSVQKMHSRGLIAKIPHSRRWRVTKKGLRVLGPLVETYA
jgi:hypothetical protein